MASCDSQHTYYFVVSGDGFCIKFCCSQLESSSAAVSGKTVKLIKKKTALNTTFKINFKAVFGSVLYFKPASDTETATSRAIAKLRERRFGRCPARAVQFNFYKANIDDAHIR